jgi:hypothetical protein
MQIDPQTTALMKDVALGQLRHYITIAGTALASHGLLAGDATSQGKFVEMGSGVAIALLGAAWSWWEKTGSAQAQARVVEIAAQLEAKKQAAAEAYAKAQAAQKAIQDAVAKPAVVVPPAPQPGANSPGV